MIAEQPEDGRSTSRRLAGAQLRRRRSAVGLTQADLAELAQISLRTLRNIESGALTPHRATLLQIAGALRLTDADSFVAGWHADRTSGPSDDELLRRPVGFDRFLSPAARRARSLEQPLTWSSHTYVGPRNVDRTVISIGVRALAPGLDRATAVAHSLQRVDWDRLAVVDLVNCRVSASRAFAEASAKSFELHYGVSLDADESYHFGYTVDFAGARLVGDPGAPCVDAGVGVRHPGVTVNLQVHFTAGHFPTAVSYEHTQRSFSVVRQLEPLRLSRFGLAQIVIPHAAAGMHSIVWTWPT